MNVATKVNTVLIRALLKKVTMTSWHFSNKRTTFIKSISENIKTLLLLKPLLTQYGKSIYSNAISWTFGYISGSLYNHTC